MKHNEIVIGLVGNPNCGKTTIFNALTGARQKVANWSGVTVEKREGHLRRGPYRIRVVDLPGTYSLTTYTIEEIITRGFILDGKPDVIVNVVDAGNLERNLFLTTQLVSIGARTVIALNMHDEARSKGMRIDEEKLGALLGMPVIPTVGTRGEGIDELIDAVIRVYEGTEKIARQIYIPFGHDAEAEIEKLRELIGEPPGIEQRYRTRWLALRLLENDADVRTRLNEHPKREAIESQATGGRTRLERAFGEPIDVIFSDARYGFISGAVHETVKKTAVTRADMSDSIDMVLTNRYLGFPILFVFLWLLFHLTFTLGEYPMTLIEGMVASLAGAADSVLSPGPLKDLLVEGVIGGVGGVIVFLPNILILFAGISFMEDTGYMARAAFIMDRIMHTIGLHGKSFIPLVMGFGCNVPAIMATRALENRQDRILTILINPFMSCSARLPLYILFAGVFFRGRAGTVILSLYAIGIAFAFLSARLHRRLFFKRASTPFVMELPPYRIPTLKSTALHMWDRSSQYLRKMGGIILAFSIIIWAMGAYPKSPEIEEHYRAREAGVTAEFEKRMAHTADTGELARIRSAYDTEHDELARDRAAALKEHSAIGRVGKAVHVVLEPLGFTWQMGVSLITGFVAKEIVVSTMGVLYHAPAGADHDAMDRSLQESLARPEYRITPLAAYVFMLFVLMYVPCLATIAAIGREAGWRWAAFSVFYQLAVAWTTSFIVYQAGILLGA
ncbi:MAG: ferrous iron transport protein B [Spirochaetes bacterium]|nr:MAG: ferrous iron transport protein B [Spirochaetota bacterium]